MNTSIESFYSKIQFPGPYTLESFDAYRDEIVNPYIKLINDYVKPSSNIIDVGCGTGFITNFLSLTYSDKDFLGVDFSDSIFFAEYFAQKNNLQAKFLRKDFLDCEFEMKYNCVICQGVLHHIPQFEKALSKLKEITEKNGYLILGLYHPFGKVLKKIVSLDYRSTILEDDQERNPYEMSYYKKSIIEKLGDKFQLESQYPRNITSHFLINPLVFSRSGGIVTYVFRKIE